MVSDLTSLSAAWGELAERVSAPPSLHPGYLLAWAAADARSRRMRAVVATRGSEIAAVLPLVMGAGGLSTTALRDLEETGIVADDEQAAVAVAERAVRLPLARLVLRPVPRGGLTATAMARAATGGQPLERSVDEYPFVDVDSDWETYWRSRSRNTRSDVTRRRRRLAELGEVRTRVLDGTEGLGAALDAAFAIEASGWKGHSGTAIAGDPAARRFHGDLARWAADRGWFRLTFLELDERPIAFHYSLQAYGVLYALKIGFADDLASHSPGTVLLADEIERAFAEGLRRFDFAGSAAHYKNRWATGSRELLEVIAFPPTPVGAAARQVERAALRLRPPVKRARARLRGLRASRLSAVRVPGRRS